MFNKIGTEVTRPLSLLTDDFVLKNSRLVMLTPDSFILLCNGTSLTFVEFDNLLPEKKQAHDPLGGTRSIAQRANQLGY
jgi:hypothetical protein